ncbi:hypothetical protein F5Y17DRAFT_49142 [Xylariaceae sp. FL0594]|nr:hypothetical protein F5Y17DRAFT_49142 [Xylariaceae sp. FL0594]
MNIEPSVTSLFFFFFCYTNAINQPQVRAKSLPLLQRAGRFLFLPYIHTYAVGCRAIRIPSPRLVQRHCSILFFSFGTHTLSTNLNHRAQLPLPWLGSLFCFFFSSLMVSSGPSHHLSWLAYLHSHSITKPTQSYVVFDVTSPKV